MVVLATNPPAALHPLDTPLLYLDQQDGQDINPWRFREAFEGTQIFGATGSGKTTGSGRSLALALLTAKFEGRYQFGGLVLCAKPEEVALWANFKDGTREDGYCKLAGREPSEVVVLGVNYKEYETLGLTVPEHGHCFDFLGYMADLGREQPSIDVTLRRRPGQFTNTLVSVFLTALESGGAKGVSSSDPYWEEALRQMLTNAIDLVLLAEKPLTISTLADLVLSAPETQAQAHSQEWQEGWCWELLSTAQETVNAHIQAAQSNPQDRHFWEARKRDLARTVAYWLLDYAGLAERTRSIVRSSFTSKATGMDRYPMRELFSPIESSFTPTDSHQGKIIILDLSVKEFGETGRFAQVLFKTIWQRATEHKSRKYFPNPVFLWADESQYFSTSEDTLFLQTARSSKAAVVYMTQNISNYYAVMGGGSGTAITDSLLANFNTKIFHANGDPATNDWAERLFGKKIRSLGSENSGGSSGTNFGQSETVLPAIPLDRFFKLRKGGVIDPKTGAYLVSAYMFIAGYPWAKKDKRNTSKHGQRVKFDQNLVAGRSNGAPAQ